MEPRCYQLNKAEDIRYNGYRACNPIDFQLRTSNTKLAESEPIVWNVLVYLLV